MQTKVITTMFGLFAELETDLIGQRTREGLSVARARGVRLGNHSSAPKGRSLLSEALLPFSFSPLAFD
jgi:DNA invertase Pin-like site-specific DNA recombinase